MLRIAAIGYWKMILYWGNCPWRRKGAGLWKIPCPLVVNKTIENEPDKLPYYLLLLERNSTGICLPVLCLNLDMWISRPSLSPRRHLISLTLRQLPSGGANPVISPILKNAWNASKYIACNINCKNLEEQVLGRD
jgi:hypothetical protein